MLLQSLMLQANGNTSRTVNTSSLGAFKHDTFKFETKHPKPKVIDLKH